MRSCRIRVSPQRISQGSYARPASIYAALGGSGVLHVLKGLRRPNGLLDEVTHLRMRLLIADSKKGALQYPGTTFATDFHLYSTGRAGSDPGGCPDARPGRLETRIVSLKTRRALYMVLAADTIVVILLVILLLKESAKMTTLLPACAVALFVIHFSLFRSRARNFAVTSDPQGEPSRDRSQKLSVYILCFVYAVGTFNEAVMIWRGELPRAVSPVLIVPALFALYCLRLARKRNRQPE